MANTKAYNKFHVLIAAAGTGTRMGSDIPKQYMQIGSKALLRHTIENALSWNHVASVHIIIHPDHQALYEAAIHGLDLPDPIIGGDERSKSVYNGTNYLKKNINLKNEDIIFIHDGARPYTHKDDIAALSAALVNHRAACLCAPVSDTIRKINGEMAADIINRDDLRALQTPQAFRLGDIIKAHAQNKANVTDDTALASAIGIDVALVTARHPNTKITTPEDFEMAKVLLGKPLDIRTGMGFDVHAFEDAPTGRKLMLCGIPVPHDRALAGHSDADVGLHALTDALLGALGEGDIGRHFPPSDNTFKDMDSAVFVDKAVRICADKGGIILNADITLICETPKITPHADAMKARVATLLGICESRVNIKATTTEKLGFTGRGEGIAAQAVVSVKI